MFYRVDNGGIGEKIIGLACSEVEIYEERICPYVEVYGRMPIYGHMLSLYISTCEHASPIIFSPIPPLSTL